MPDTQIVAAPTRDLATLPIEQAIDLYAPNFADALPESVPLAHFKRMVVTAVNLNPDLRNADRRTFLNACVKLAADGLMPDGRDAALVIYKTKIKIGGHEHWIDAVQAMPMVYGIRRRMRNSGEVLSADAHVVYRGDKFRYALGDHPYIEHEPAGLDTDPGDVVGAYAIIRLKNGEVLRDVLRKSGIERARSASKAPNGPMWKDYYSEAARKTALRRCSKGAPQEAAFLQRMLDRDEETVELPPGTELPSVPLRPTRADFVDSDGGDGGETVVEDETSFTLVDADGLEHELGDPETVAARMDEVLTEAHKRGGKTFNGVGESNNDLLTFLREQGHQAIASRIVQRFKELAAQPFPGEAAKTAAPVADERMVPRSVPSTEPVIVKPDPAFLAAGGNPPTLVPDPPPPRNPWFDGESLVLVPRARNGKSDWPTWVAAQFLPRLRQATITADMAKFLGDNAGNLDEARRAIGAAEAATLNAEIAAQWARVPADS